MMGDNVCRRYKEQWTSLVFGSSIEGKEMYGCVKEQKG